MALGSTGLSAFAIGYVASRIMPAARRKCPVSASSGRCWASQRRASPSCAALIGACALIFIAKWLRRFVFIAKWLRRRG